MTTDVIFDREMVTKVRDRIKELNEKRQALIDQINADEDERETERNWLYKSEEGTIPGLHMNTWFSVKDRDGINKQVKDKYLVDGDVRYDEEVLIQATGYKDLIVDKFIDPSLQLCGTSACIAGEAVLVHNGFDRLLVERSGYVSEYDPETGLTNQQLADKGTYRMDWYKRDENGNIVTETQTMTGSRWDHETETYVDFEFTVNAPVVERTEGIYDIQGTGADLLGLVNDSDKSLVTPSRLFYPQAWPRHYRNLVDDEDWTDGQAMELILTDLLDGNYQHWLDEYGYYDDDDDPEWIAVTDCECESCQAARERDAARA